MRFAYADPPYPGQAKRWYGDHPDYAGEVDHAGLIARLGREYPDGWALSTSAAALRQVLMLCPPDIEIAVWHVTNASYQGRGNKLWRSWEAVLFRGGRQRRDGAEIVRNVFTAGYPGNPPGGRLRGKKPAGFSRWVFALLGALPGDHLDDLFPGTGAVTAEWLAYERQGVIA